MRRLLLTISIITVLVLAVSVMVYAQMGARENPPTKLPEQTTMKGALSMADRHFVSEAAIGGLEEVKLGDIAAKKAQSQDVKDFANRMVTDHGKANDELKALAREKHGMLPTKLDMKHASDVSRLSKLSGEEFDKAYMSEMVKDHVKDVAKFRDASSTLQDEDLKTWASKTLPTLEEHLTLAKSAAQKLGLNVNQIEQKANATEKPKTP